jgi:HD-GYP domain-containing protein (c-di-GMP phosphodiesterase class II)
VTNPGKKGAYVDYDDPFEAIFALNVGDFVAEDFLSKDLLERISSKINVSPEEKYKRLKEQLQELISIYSIDNTLNLLGFEGEEGFVVYDSIAITIANMIGMDCCNIFLKPDILPLLKTTTSKELVLFGTSCKDKSRDTGFGFGEISPLTQAYREKQTIQIKNIKMNPYWKPRNVLGEKEIVSLLSVPMHSGQTAIGIINLYSNEEKEIPQANINLIESIAAIFSVSIRLQDLMDEANELIKDEGASSSDMTRVRAQLTGSIGDLGIEQQRFVEALAGAVDAKSDFTKEHSRKVAELARYISLEMNLNEKTIDLIYYAGLLQNIGKIMIPGELFSKKESLTEEDWKKLQDHPNVGVNLLMKVNFLSEVVPYINYYRERWDGKGQPEGLEGMSIPLGSRIIAVADAYQAMVSERAYRNPMTEDQAIKVMKKEAGTKWDPAVVDALISYISQKKIK